jgi:alcohol dehydrogenase
MFNLEAIKAVSQNLERAVKDGSDIEAREGMAYGQFVTGMGFSNCGLGIVHSMAHQLGGFYDLPHGVCNAILLPYVMEYNAAETGDKYRTIAEAMGVDTEGMDLETARAACINAVKNLSQAVGIPADFTTLGVKKEDIDQLADLAMIDVCTPGNPRDPEVEDMVELYQKVF